MGLLFLYVPPPYYTTFFYISLEYVYYHVLPISYLFFMAFFPHDLRTTSDRIRPMWPILRVPTTSRISIKSLQLAILFFLLLLVAENAGFCIKNKESRYKRFRTIYNRVPGLFDVVMDTSDIPLPAQVYSQYSRFCDLYSSLFIVNKRNEYLSPR